MKLKVVVTLLLLGSVCCPAQTINDMTKNNNPLLCNPEDGVCEIPANPALVSRPSKIVEREKPVTIVYFTDPICSSCWGIEPQLRKLKLEYGDVIHIEYRMGGLLRDWTYSSGSINKPSDVAHHWDEVSRYYDMPIDGDVWLENPLHSSYPPSIAFKAAQIQDEQKAIDFLRRIREMVFIEKRNITEWSNLKTAAEQTDLDADKLKKDMEGRAKEDFETDLLLAKTLGIRGFPTMLFQPVENSKNELKIYGYKPYAAFEEAILTLLPGVVKRTYDKSWQALFKRFPSLTTLEFATLTGLDKVESERQLQNLVTEKKLVSKTTKNGMLWIKSSNTSVTD